MPTTTMMKDSQIGDEWITAACRANPVQFMTDASGKPTSNVLTCPVRLAFTDALFEPQHKMKNDPTSSKNYNCSLLFPPTADMSIFNNEYNRIASAEFAAHWNGTGWGGLDPAWRNQGEKPQYAGYTNGLWFMNVSSQFKPPIVDSMYNPIVDPAQIYAGCWAIVLLNGYASGKNTPRKGPRFGLQTIMKLADDTNLGGAAVDPRAAFSSVRVAPPSNAAAAFAGRPPQHPPGGQQQFGAAAVAQVYGAVPAQPVYGAVPADEDLSGFM